MSKFSRVDRRQNAFTLIELMLVVTVLSILVVMAVPYFMASKMQANETSAIASLRNISLAQTQYRVRFGAYATLANLTASELVDASFSDGVKSGYQFDADGPLTSAEWAFTAEPVSPGASGDRWFYVDATGVIRFREGASAGSTDPAIP